MKLALLMVLAATTASAAPPGAIATIDRVAARVNGKPIWKSDVEDRVAAGAKAAGQPAKPEAYSETLDAMIDQAVILARADELHITTTPPEIDAAIDSIKSSNQIDDTQLDAALASQGMNREQYRVELAIQIRVQRTMFLELGGQIQVTEDDIAKAYADAKAKKPDAPALDAKLHDELKQQLFMKRFDEVREPWLKKRRALAHVERLP